MVHTHVQMHSDHTNVFVLTFLASLCSAANHSTNEISQIILPLTVEEYQIAQLYAVAEASKSETGGGDGVEILKNEPFDTEVFPPNPPLLNGDPHYTTGQYTHKYYYLSQKVPGIVRTFAPTSALILTEEAWNAYPYCRTILTNNFMKESFSIMIESLHSSDITLQNAHQLSPKELSAREVVVIDIGDITPSDKDYNPSEDPTRFHSEKAGRGPLKPKWWLLDAQLEPEFDKTRVMRPPDEIHLDLPLRINGYTGPLMCCYKLVRCECKIPLLQGRLEGMIQRQERRLFANFHRQVFCWMDRWYGMTMQDIRLLEEQTKRELEEQRKRGSLRGHKGEE